MSHCIRVDIVLLGRLHLLYLYMIKNRSAIIPGTVFIRYHTFASDQENLLCLIGFLILTCLNGPSNFMCSISSLSCHLM